MPTTLQAPPPPPEPDETKRKIVRLMRRLRRRNRLRRVISAGSGVPLDLPETVPTLLEVLRSTTERQWWERTIAIAALRQATILPEQRLETATLLGRILNGRDESGFSRIIKRVLRLMARLLTWVFLIFAFGAVVSALGLPNFLPEWMLFPFAISGVMMLLFTPLLLLVSPLWDMTHARAVRVEAAKTLRHLQLPESVGALARAARKPDHTGRLARYTLYDLLPTLTAAHYGQLPSETTPELCALLHTSGLSNSLTGKVLEALGEVGDGRAVEPVEKWMRRHARSALGAQAERILPVLLARREQERASSMLLRGSSAPEAKPTELLRAASYVSTTEPEQLLRATLSPNHDTNAPKG